MECMKNIRQNSREGDRDVDRNPASGTRCHGTLKTHREGRGETGRFSSCCATLPGGHYPRHIQREARVCVPFDILIALSCGSIVSFRISMEFCYHPTVALVLSSSSNITSYCYLTICFFMTLKYRKINIRIRDKLQVNINDGRRYMLSSARV
jgi:hypothetical protein